MSTRPAFTVLSVRPYGARVRDRVFACIASAGMVIADDPIAAGTQDSEVVELLRRREGATLLIPFNAHHGGQGDLLTGVDLVERIDQALPGWRRFPILMPVSAFGAAGAVLRLGALPASLRGRILSFGEDQLDDRELPLRLRRHVEAHLARPGVTR